MSVNRKLNTREFALIFSAANLLIFLLYFIPYYVLDTKEITAGYEYLRLYVDEILHWILPPATATVLTVRCVNDNFKKTLVTALVLSLPNLAYTIPFYYILGIEYGGDTPEALGISFLTSLGYLLIFYIHIIVLYLIIKRSVIFFTAKELTKKLPKKYRTNHTAELWQGWLKDAQNALPYKITEGKTFDLSSPTTIALFFASLFEFSIYISIEICNAASYLINYLGSYKSTEIAYMIFRFIFILAMLFFALWISQIIKRHTMIDESDSIKTE